MKSLTEIAAMDDADLRVSCAHLDGWTGAFETCYDSDDDTFYLSGIHESGESRVPYYAIDRDPTHAAIARHIITPLERQSEPSPRPANRFERFEFALHQLCAGPVWHASARVLCVCFVWAMQEE